MKLCPNCDQPVAENIATCPACGSEVGRGRTHIDDYKIVDVLHEGYASFLCRAVRERTNEEVIIRLFKPQSGVDAAVADRLQRELERLKQLPGEDFIRHHAIRRSSDGLWYRISEWIDTEGWGSILASGVLNDLQVVLDLFYQTASILDVLHQNGYLIPHLILNDIIVVKQADDKLRIKIDYKLSRFFDPKLDRPGPMLGRLLDCHPDIRHEQPLDLKSDIWSLGKIFVELLTADLKCTDFVARADELQIPPELKVLLKVMLAEDPDLRPRSMAEVAASLARIIKEEGEKVAVAAAATPVASARPSASLSKIFSLAICFALVLVAGFFALYQLVNDKQDVASSIEAYANKYARSVAFVLVEYWLEAEKERVYQNMAEGTAFLVDADGYLLTSRHVVCPWLEDTRLLSLIYNLRQMNRDPSFGYRIFLWFEGERAFNQVARLIQSADITDSYFVETAFRTEESPRLVIAGVAKPPIRTRQMLTSPLKDDFAVLKIEHVPAELTPLPLDLKMDSQKIPKLSRVIALGFPLGRRTQAATVNVSVTSGHVRRSFQNLLQIDASLHGGNSGGPIINTQGKVIGIATGVALGMAQGIVPVVTPLWDMGMILPITKAVEFLKELKAGQVKWNGVLDLSVEATLKKVKDLAGKGRWAEAMQAADAKLEAGLQPELVLAAGIMHFGAEDLHGARRLFTQAVSMDDENSLAKLMLFIIDWLDTAQNQEAHRNDLIALDWRAQAEFEGYLARVLLDLVDDAAAAKGWYNSAEKAWLLYLRGLKRYKREAWVEAQKLIRAAVLSADTDNWAFFLARSGLDQIQKQRRQTLQTKEALIRFRAEIEKFETAVKEALTEKSRRDSRLKTIQTKLSQAGIGLENKVALLGEMLGVDSDNRYLWTALAFYNAALEKWAPALEAIGTFRALEGRDNADRMSLGLLEAGIWHKQAKTQKARSLLEHYAQNILDPWYLMLSEHLLGKRTEEAVLQEAGQSPEKLITGHTVLGFWAEGSGNQKKAIKYYKEALESFLDTWLEYDFAQARLIELKKKPSISVQG